MSLTAVILWLVAFIFLIIIIKNVISRATKKKRCTATTNAVIKDVKERFITLMSTEYSQATNVLQPIHTEFPLPQVKASCTYSHLFQPLEPP